MALQFVIDEDGFNGLDESMRGMYQKDGDGYKLAVEGLPQGEDVSGLKAQRDKLLAEKKAAADRAREAEEAAAREAAESAKKAGDFESLYNSALEKAGSWEEKYNELLSKIAGEKADSQAMSIAADLADGNNAKILARFIRDRIKVGDDGNVVVLNESGEPTVSSLDDLKKEFTTSGEFNSLLRGNKAAGGGATQHTGGGAVKKWADYTPAELSIIRRENQAEYDRLKTTMN